MLFSYLSLGALAVTANAFLYVPNPDELAATGQSLDSGHQTISIDCTSCPYALKSERNGQHEWTNDVASDLKMDLTVVNNAITLNGVTIYPVVNPGLPPALTVKQSVKKGVDTTMEGLDHDLRLSYSLEIAKTLVDGHNIITITLSPMALDGQMIRVEDLVISATEAPNGDLLLHVLQTVAPSPDAPDAKCNNVMCRVMSKIVSGITRVKSAAKTAAHKVKCICAKCYKCILRMMGKKPHHHHGHHEVQSGTPGIPGRLPGTLDLPTHHHFKPQDGRPHHHHHNWQHKSFFGRMVHIMWLTVKIAFIPILIGIAFGMAASAIGMLVGQAVVLLWIRYRRNDEAPAYEALPTDEKEEVPPPYEDLPAAVQQAINEKDIELKA